MVEWLDSVHEALGCSLATFAHAVALMDRFMSLEHARADRLDAACVARASSSAHDAHMCAGAEEEEDDSDGDDELPIVGEAQLQLVAMTCLLLAVKLVEDQPPREFASLERYCDLCGHGRYPWQSVHAMEQHVCARLRWRLDAPSPFGELRELVLAERLPPLCRVRAATRRSARADDISDISDDDDDDDDANDDGVEARGARARARSRCVVVDSAIALPRAACHAAELGSLCLQACVYATPNLVDTFDARALAEAALRAARDELARREGGGRRSSRLSAVSDAATERASSSSAAELSSRIDDDDDTRNASDRAARSAARVDAPRALALVDQLSAQMRAMLEAVFKGAALADGALARLADEAHGQRWELPRCLASKRRHAQPRPLEPARARAPAAAAPLYALHDALTQHAQLAAAAPTTASRPSRAVSPSLSSAASARALSPCVDSGGALDARADASAAAGAPLDADARAPARRAGRPTRSDADASDGFGGLPPRCQRSLSCDSSASASSYASTALESPRWAASKPAAKTERWQHRRRVLGRAAKTRTAATWRRESLAPLADGGWEAHASTEQAA